MCAGTASSQTRRKCLPCRGLACRLALRCWAAPGAGGDTGTYFPRYLACTHAGQANERGFVLRYTRCRGGTRITEHKKAHARRAVTMTRRAVRGPVATNARGGRDPGRAQHPNNRADSAAPGTERERPRIATQEAHVASAPKRWRPPTSQRDTRPCRLRTVPIRSAVVAPATVQNAPSPTSKPETSHESQHRKMLGVVVPKGCKEVPHR